MAQPTVLLQCQALCGFSDYDFVYAFDVKVLIVLIVLKYLLSPYDDFFF